MSCPIRPLEPGHGDSRETDLIEARRVRQSTRADYNGRPVTPRASRRTLASDPGEHRLAFEGLMNSVSPAPGLAGGAIAQRIQMGRQVMDLVGPKDIEGHGWMGRDQTLFKRGG